ncbi:hypothetical protein ACFO4E_24850 [Nocardiopsis mangrovi]|uniref:Transposase n=1 Tax=Nocardiopsis mangrovi TaxID=1179818 RepID=A0ABV9E324_9ACTN
MKQGTYEYQTDLFRRPFLDGRKEGEELGEAKGQAEGKANAVLLVLSARGIDVTDSIRERVDACTDIPTLDTWIGRAATVDNAEELFA